MLEATTVAFLYWNTAALVPVLLSLCLTLTHEENRKKQSAKEQPQKPSRQLTWRGFNFRYRNENIYLFSFRQRTRR